MTLATGLPRDSAVIRAELGESASWSLTEHLLAVLIETIDVTSWRAVMPHAKKGWRPPKPTQIPRPVAEQERRQKRKATSEDLVRIFGAAGRYTPGGDN